MNTLKVAVCQMTSANDVEKNFSQIFELLNEVERTGNVDLVCFPENALFLKIDDPKLPSIELHDGQFQRLAKWASDHKAVLHLGSVPLLREGAVYNASLLIREDGSISSPYQKIHLFDVDVVGAPPVRESDSFKHGEKPSTFDVKGWKIGSSICYDLRFSELFYQYAKAGVDVILIPAAFLVPTGKAHWEVLLRARAIESQCYVLASAQGGKHISQSGAIRETFGHSMIVDPWGEVLAACRENDESLSIQKRVLRGELSKERIAKVRSQIPMAAHRRL